jgi:hypothetical protein
MKTLIGPIVAMGPKHDRDGYVAMSSFGRFR